MRLHVRSSRSCRRSGRRATRWTAACADAVFDLDRQGLARDTDSRPRLTADRSPVDGSRIAFTLRAVGRRWTEHMIRRELEAFLPGFDTFPQYPVFRASGRRGLWQAMAKRGGP